MDISRIKQLRAEATVGPWILQEGCSWRRFGSSPGKDGDILCPINDTDGHPNLLARHADLEFIAALPEIGDECIRLAERVKMLERILDDHEIGYPKMMSDLA